jgi:two-component system, cell cycle sensor histidine kinase and response regulator CckA
VVKPEMKHDFEVFFKQSSDLIAITGFDGMFIKVNPAWTEVLGFAEQELLKASFLGLMHADDRGEAAAIVDRLNRESKSATVAGQFKTKAGYDRLLHCTVTSDVDQRQIYICGREMPGWRTPEERAGAKPVERLRIGGATTEALRHAVETLNSIIVACPHAIIAVDRDRNVRIWNPAATRIFGWTDEEVMGHRVPFVSEEQRQQSDAFNDRVLQGESLNNFEVRRSRRDGKDVDLLVSAAPSHDANGMIDGFVTVASDITEHKSLEQQFLRTQRLESLGTLAGGIAHDLNNVLAPISMSLELIRMKSVDPSLNRTLDTLASCVTRGAGLIRQILTFARGVQGERTPIETRYVLQDVQKVVFETMPRSIEVKTDIPKGLWAISADTTQFHQVLMNLCVNARDAMGEAGGVLQIIANNLVLDEAFVRMSNGPATGPHVLIEVRDSGSGIPAAIQSKIFEPFFTTKEVGKGTGLGLSTVAAIVRNHGGFINLYSEMGRGTSFRVYFPAVPSSGEQQKSETRCPLPTGNGELILVVDDESAVRDIAALTLESYGYRVLQASDGADGVAVYAQNVKDVRLVISDHDMPVMNGAAMIRSLERINPEVRVLCASGLAGESPADLSSPLRKVLPKPYTAEQLLHAVRDLIAAA